MKSKVTLLNMITGFILQLLTIISGFIIPKIILIHFGSEINGLVASLNQFLSYINLVEGGITGVIMANLYKPLTDRNMEKLSSIIVTTNKFYKKIGLVFIGYTIILAFVYPLLVKSNFSYTFIFSLTIILSLCLLIQYMFSLTLRTLLIADKCGYVVNITQSAIVFSNILLAIISVKIYPSIHFLKLLSGLLFLLQPIMYHRFIKRKYNINWKAKQNNSLIKERWNGFAINFAAFIHNSTDITILTCFTNLKMVSVYSVYSLVSNGIKQLIDASLSGIAQTVGHAYAKRDFKELNLKMDLYEYVVFFLVFLISSIAILLITPFVVLYTHNVTDTNYYQPLFGYLLIASEALYLIKLPHLNLAYSANKFKEIRLPAFFEAFLNIIISLFFVRKYGLIGVTFGTIVGMTYRMMFHVRYTKNIIPDRSPNKFYKKLMLFLITSAIGIFICTYFIHITISIV